MAPLPALRSQCGSHPSNAGTRGFNPLTGAARMAKWGPTSRRNPECLHPGESIHFGHSTMTLRCGGCPAACVIRGPPSDRPAFSDPRPFGRWNFVLLTGQRITIPSTMGTNATTTIAQIVETSASAIEPWAKPNHACCSSPVRKASREALKASESVSRSMATPPWRGAAPTVVDRRLLLAATRSPSESTPRYRRANLRPSGFPSAESGPRNCEWPESAATNPGA